MGCYAYYRLATEAEIASIEADEEEERVLRQASMERQVAVKRIADEIREMGNRPEGDNQPEGRCYLNTQDIYGGGSWFVIGSDWIWYVQNNGADGDDWSRNNVRTGGAGAIGWRAPYSDDLARKIKALELSINS